MFYFSTLPTRSKTVNRIRSTHTRYTEIANINLVARIAIIFTSSVREYVTRTADSHTDIIKLANIIVAGKIYRRHCGRRAGNITAGLSQSFSWGALFSKSHERTFNVVEHLVLGIAKKI